MNRYQKSYNEFHKNIKKQLKNFINFMKITIIEKKFISFCKK